MKTRQVRFGIDVDGCLRDIFTVFNDLMKKNHPELVIKPEPDRYNMNNIDLPLPEKIKLWNGIYAKEIFADSPPMPGAIESFFRFQKWALERDIKLVCATKQTLENAHYTFDWLHRHGIHFSEYHITGDKHKLNLDYIIDDAPNHYEDWVSCGNKEQNFFLMSGVYNEYMDVTNRVKSYDDVIKILNKKKWQKVNV